MIEEVENYGAVLHPRGAQFLSALTASDVPVTASAHSPITPTGAVTNSGRSNGWTELRARRVQAKERAVRDLPTDAFEALTPNTKLVSLSGHLYSFSCLSFTNSVFVDHCVLGVAYSYKR